MWIARKDNRRGRLNKAGFYLFTMILATLLAVVGCEEEEVYTVSQEEEIERFVTDSDDGRELFGALDLDSSWTFSLPDNDTTYTATLVATSRSLSVSTAGPRDFGIGNYYYGFAAVMDQAVGILRKQAGGRTVETEFRWYIERVGFFVKLGDNNQPFSGWLLRGYYGGPPTNHLDIATSAGVELDNVGSGVLVGDKMYVDAVYAFKDIDEVASVAKGSQIIFDGCPNCVIFVNYESASGSQTTNLTDEETDSLCFCDTLVTSANTDRFWSMLCLTKVCMSADSTVTVDHSIIPYKLSQ